MPTYYMGTCWPKWLGGRGHKWQRAAYGKTLKDYVYCPRCRTMKIRPKNF